jgi:peptidoglycan/LPS O-acetylase OafA/YrhL
VHIALAVASASAQMAAALHFGDLGHGWGWNDFWVAPIRLAYPFLTGLLIRRLGLRIAVPQPFLLMSAVLLAVFTAPLFGRFNGLAEAACVIVLFPLVLAAGAAPRRESGRIARLCVFIGDLSYPLYIVHYPFLYLFGHWNWTTHPGPWRRGLAVAGLYAAIVLLAYLLLRFYDRPVRAWLSRQPGGHFGRIAQPAQEIE